MNLSKYISDLLFKNDKVIIPGFGVFICKDIPANIHPIKHSFSPPSKEILFKSDIQENDDLLIDYISSSENISKSLASKNIADFVENCKTELEKNKFVSLAEIGKLQIDRQGKISFIQDRTKNFNLNSFGLSDFISPAIKRIDTEKQKDKNLTENTKIKKHNYQWIWIAATGLIAIILAYIIFDMYKQYQTYSFLSNKTKKEKTILNQANTGKIPEENLLQNKVLDSTENISDTTNQNIEIYKKEEVVLEVEKKKFFIIAGCFKSLDKAEKYLIKLKNNGFDASIEGQTKTGLHRVCYEGYASKQEAEKALKKLRSEGKYSGWIIEIN